MTIHLSEEDRANLERLEKDRMKPTRRQKAIALLRLAVGMSPAKTSEHAGISKAEVEALAAQFAESGLTGVGLGGKPKNVVRLVRPGVGVRTYRLQQGATLADLLRRAAATATNQVIFIDGVLAADRGRHCRQIHCVRISAVSVKYANSPALERKRFSS
jgi:hypothetical protein